jgi:hypothetical protein
MPFVNDIPGAIVGAGKTHEFTFKLPRLWKMVDIAIAEGFEITEFSIGPESNDGKRDSYTAEDIAALTFAVRRILPSDSVKLTFTNTTSDDLEFAGEFAEEPAPVGASTVRKLAGTRVGPSISANLNPTSPRPNYPNGGNANGNGHAGSGQSLVARLQQSRVQEPEPEHIDAGPHPHDGDAQVAYDTAGRVTFRPGVNEVVVILPRVHAENLLKLATSNYVPPWELQGAQRYLELALHPSAGKRQPQNVRPTAGVPLGARR